MQVTREDYGRWQLPENLVELSDGSSFPGVLREWELDYIEHLAPGEDSETCLCTHNPIREVCHIRNLQNGNTAIVGNCCVKKFEKEEEYAANFEGTHKVFDALKRLQKNENANANEELLNYSYTKGIITKHEYDTYLEIWRNRTFTDAESRLILTANRKIINHASSKAMRERIALQREEKARRQSSSVPPENVVRNPGAPDWKGSQAQMPTRSAVAPKMQTWNPVALNAPARQIPTYSSRTPQQAGTANPIPTVGLPKPVALTSPLSDRVSFPQASPMSQPVIISSAVSRSSQQASESGSTPFVAKRSLDQLLADLKANHDRVADVQIVQEAYAQKILEKHEQEFYIQMVGMFGKSAMSPKQQNWISALNKKIISKLKLNVRTADIQEATPRRLKLAERHVIIDGYNRRLIKEKDRDFYLGLIDQKATSPSDKQKNWVDDIHKRLRIEDDQTEANSNARPAKRALNMEDPFEDKASK